jgi:hypothetical protein
MYKKGWVAVAFYGAGVKEAPKLAVPEKEADTGYIMLIKDQLLRVQVELLIKAVKFGQDKDKH